MKQAQIVLYSDIVVGGGLEIKMKNIFLFKRFFLTLSLSVYFKATNDKVFGFSCACFKAKKLDYVAASTLLILLDRGKAYYILFCTL